MPEIILDQSRDVAGLEIHRLKSLHTPPDFVKKAGHERLCGDPERTPAHLYADPIQKLYPTHTPEATWMSAAFFFDKQAEFPADKQADYTTAILKAADYFGIRGHVDALRTKIAAEADDDESKLPDEMFAIVWKYANDHKDRQWPLRNGREVGFAANHFMKHRDKFEFDDRHVIAERILDAAVKFGAAIDGGTHVLELSAGRGACSARDAATACRQRAGLVRQKHPDMSGELEKMAQIILECPDQARGRDQLLKIASLLDSVDRAGHLVELYDEGGLERPEEILFRITEKVASAFVAANVATINGNVYDLNQLEKISVAKYREWLGDDIADAVTIGGVMTDREKLAEVIPTLDRSLAARLDRMVAADGIAPVIREKAAAVEAPLSGQRLYDMAVKYSRKATAKS